MRRSKKIIYRLDKLTSDEIYAILDTVGSDDEADIDNVMNDSDTEFTVSDDTAETISTRTLERGVEAVIHSEIPDFAGDGENGGETPRGINDFTWRSRGSGIERRPCLNHGEIKIDIDENAIPLDVFYSVVGFDDLLELLVTESIRYAHQNGREFFVEINEMAAFIGINYIMAIDVQPNLKSYWSVNEIRGNSRIQKVMTRSRFEEILQNLHFSNNLETDDTSPEHVDRARKIRPLLNHLNKHFQDARNNTEKQSIDEHMCQHKGVSSMKQYMRNKPIKWGFKFWCRSCSESGYLYEIDIYCGKNDQSGVGLGESVVLNLTRRLHHSYITIHCDNFFTSPSLVKALLDNGLYYVGTVRPNRKFMPKSFKVSCTV